MGGQRKIAQCGMIYLDSVLCPVVADGRKVISEMPDTWLCGGQREKQVASLLRVFPSFQVIAMPTIRETQRQKACLRDVFRISFFLSLSVASNLANRFKLKL